MGVVIRDVLGESGEGSRVRFEHDGRLLEAMLAEPPEAARLLIGHVTHVEFGHSAVTTWRRAPATSRDAAGLYPAGPGSTRIVGEVVHVDDIGDGDRVYDVRMAPGLECVALAGHELGGEDLEVGAWIDVTVEGFCLYPTNE